MDTHTNTLVHFQAFRSVCVRCRLHIARGRPASAQSQAPCPGHIYSPVSRAQAPGHRRRDTGAGTQAPGHRRKDPDTGGAMRVLDYVLGGHMHVNMDISPLPRRCTCLQLRAPQQ